MPFIYTDNLPVLTQQTNHSVYNGLDCCITLEVWQQLQRLFNEPPEVYNFERALQAPALDMMLRGFKINNYARYEAIKVLRKDLDFAQDRLQRLAFAIWQKPLNPGSSKQLIQFFYQHMRLPEQWISFKGKKRLSANREALEKLDVYFYARPLVALILEIRDLAKQISVLETEIDPDGRMRTSYNIAGTETFRWSSSANSTGTGTNLQNIAPKLRYVFVADPGWKICGIDLEQAESREVGWLCGILFDDWRYLDACDSGDLHTLTCKLIWPNKAWTGDAKKDRALADEIFYREFSYRDMSKRGGHGCLTEDHEVLTPNGWVPITEKPDVIMTWSQNKSTFAQVSTWTDFEYSGTLHTYKGTSLDLTMTADHRVPFCKDQRYPCTVQTADKGPGAYMPLGWGWEGGSVVVPARLIAAFMCDGHQKSPNRMEFHFHKERKKVRLIDLCAKYGFEYHIGKDKITVHGNFPKHPGSFMFTWTKECLNDFLDEYKFWDGHQSAMAVCIFSSIREDLDWIQTFGRICGIGGNFQKTLISGFGTTMHRLQQNSRKYATGRSVTHERTLAESVRVLCPTVPSTFFYVRRNGKITVTGNSNYYGTPFTMARHLKVPVKLMEDFQKAYFSAFPAIPRWHRYVAKEIQTTRHLTTPFGVTRTFFGRSNDDATLREAIAFSPQSSTGVRMNLAIWKIWRAMSDRVQLLAQVHDAVYFQYPETADEKAIIEEALALINIPLTHGNRTFTVPGEAKVGWNWGNASEKNPDGLQKWKGSDTRKRTLAINSIL